MGLWYLERGSDSCIYLCCNGSRLQAPSGKGEIGAILDAKVQTHSSKSYIVVSIADLLQKAFNMVEYGCLCINKLHFDMETSLHNPSKLKRKRLHLYSLLIPVQGLRRTASGT